jgi:hypothetical protein
MNKSVWLQHSNRLEQQHSHVNSQRSPKSTDPKFKETNSPLLYQNLIIFKDVQSFFYSILLNLIKFFILTYRFIVLSYQTVYYSIYFNFKKYRFVVFNNIVQTVDSDTPDTVLSSLSPLNVYSTTSTTSTSSLLTQTSLLLKNIDPPNHVCIVFNEPELEDDYDSLEKTCQTIIDTFKSVGINRITFYSFEGIFTFYVK